MNVIIVFPKMENGRYIKRILLQNGFEANAVCTTGARALQYANELSGGIVVCGYRFEDMLYSELYEYLPPQFEMLLIASASVCSSRERRENKKDTVIPSKGRAPFGNNKEILKDTSMPFGNNKEILKDTSMPFGNNKEILKDTSMPFGNNKEIVCLKMPLMVHELVQTMNMMSASFLRKRKHFHGKKERPDEEKKLLSDAKALLMERNHMTEEEAHRYLQKRSMDNGTGLMETAQMVLSVMKP